MKDRGLLERIEAFEFDEGPAALTFTKRLARENGWNVAFAERVIAEYKRFVYLALVAGHPVTPSDEVDQAWHLHMLYTRSYFDRFCGGVLGRQHAHGLAEDRRRGDTRRTGALRRRTAASCPPQSATTTLEANVWHRGA